MSRQGERLLQIYTGDGKGKTTAATGLIVRALGQGWRVLLVRFLKPDQPESGELKLLRQQPGLTLLNAGIGVIGRKVDRDELQANVAATFARATQLLAAEPFDLAVFDEINNCLNRGHLPLDELITFLDQRPDNLEVVCTGRYAPDELLARADLVTRMEKIRHPYDDGIPAREGIEF